MDCTIHILSHVAFAPPAQHERVLTPYASVAPALNPWGHSMRKFDAAAPHRIGRWKRATLRADIRLHTN